MNNALILQRMNDNSFNVFLDRGPLANRMVLFSTTHKIVALIFFMYLYIRYAFGNKITKGHESV